MTSDRVLGAYVRGRLFMAGVRGNTPLTDVLDVLSVVVLDTRADVLEKWRNGLDRAIQIAQIKAGQLPDRSQWGLTPDQIEASQRFMQQQARGQG